MTPTDKPNETAVNKPTEDEIAMVRAAIEARDLSRTLELTANLCRRMEYHPRGEDFIEIADLLDKIAGTEND